MSPQMAVASVSSIAEIVCIQPDKVAIKTVEITIDFLDMVYSSKGKTPEEHTFPAGWCVPTGWFMNDCAIARYAAK